MFGRMGGISISLSHYNTTLQFRHTLFSLMTITCMHSVMYTWSFFVGFHFPRQFKVQMTLCFRLNCKTLKQNRNPWPDEAASVWKPAKACHVKIIILLCFQQFQTHPTKIEITFKNVGDTIIDLIHFSVNIIEIWYKIENIITSML